MRMHLLAVGAVLVFCANSSWANIVTSESNLEELVKGKGTGTTATVNLSGASDTQIIYTTPAVGTYYLNQLCGSQVTGGVVLAVTGFGTIAQTGAEQCLTFDSGVVLPRNATVTCATTAAAAPGTSYFCTISGFVGKK